ncbi:pyruvate formate lyase family protein [Shigella flexneri]
MVRFLRTPDTMNCSLATQFGQPNLSAAWALTVVSVTKNSFRFLNTLYNGSVSGANMTILWFEKLPLNFKKIRRGTAIDTSSRGYQHDDLMRPDFHNDDYAIACCVSPMVVGKQMQFFGARANARKPCVRDQRRR